MQGPAGPPFCIYWSQVSEDSDGPLEWCRPVPDDQAEQLAGEMPELTLRTEPAHREAFVSLGQATQVSPAEWQLVSESMHAWAEDQKIRPSDLGMRITYISSTPPDEIRGPDCDFAVPFEACLGASRPSVPISRTWLRVCRPTARRSDWHSASLTSARSAASGAAPGIRSIDEPRTVA